MRDVLLVTVVVLTGLAPDFASADQICQNRRTGQISRQARCVGKFQPAWIFNDLQGQIESGLIDARKDVEARQVLLVEQLEGFERKLADAKKDVDAQQTLLNDQLKGFEEELASGFASIVLLSARFPVGGADIRNEAITGTHVRDGSLELADLAVPVMLPHAAAAATEDWRVVTAELDLDGADPDTIGVENDDDWLALSFLNPPEATVEFTIAEGSFAERPRCLGSLSQSGSPDAAQNLEVQVVGEVGEERIRVRVVGTDRRLNVHGTVLCAGVAGAL